jgi:hypothetical protein
MAQPYMDDEDEVLARRLKFADELRRQALNTQGQMVGRILVPKSPWENFAQGFASGYMGDRAEMAQRALRQRRQGEMAEFMRRLPPTVEDVPSWSPQQLEAGPPEESTVPAATRQIPIPYERQVENFQKWAGTAPAHMGGAPQAAVLAQALAAPQKALEREDAQEQRRVELLIKAREAAQLKREADERAAAERRVREDEAEARRQLENADRKERRESEIRLVASLRPPRESQRDRFQIVTDADGSQVRVNLDTGEKFPLDMKKPLTGTEKKMSAAEEKRTTARSDLRAKIDRAEKLLVENPDAAGLKTLLPNLVLQRFNTSGERVANAATSELAAEKAHELYGAAFTAAEIQRAGKFLPAEGDSYETLLDKFHNLREILGATETKSIGAPKPATGIDAIPKEKTIVREVRLKDGRIGVEYSDGTRGFK